jgi:hypothetical protein
MSQRTLLADERRVEDLVGEQTVVGPASPRRVRVAVLGPDYGFVIEAKPQTKRVWLDFDYPTGVDVRSQTEGRIGRSICLDVDRTGIVLGRGDASDISIMDDLVSRRHLRLSYDSTMDRVTVQDLNSLNGTAMNGSKLYGPHKRQTRNPAVLSLGTGNVKVSYT